MYLHFEKKAIEGKKKKRRNQISLLAMVNRERKWNAQKSRKVKQHIRKDCSNALLCGAIEGASFPFFFFFFDAQETE